MYICVYYRHTHPYTHIYIYIYININNLCISVSIYTHTLANPSAARWLSGGVISSGSMYAVMCGSREAPQLALLIVQCSSFNEQNRVVGYIIL